MCRIWSSSVSYVSDLLRIIKLKSQHGKNRYNYLFVSILY